MCCRNDSQVYDGLVNELEQKCINKDITMCQLDSYCKEKFGRDHYCVCIHILSYMIENFEEIVSYVTYKKNLHNIIS